MCPRERGERPVTTHPGCSPNLGVQYSQNVVSCIMLKVMAYDRRATSHAEFCEHRSRDISKTKVLPGCQMLLLSAKSQIVVFHCIRSQELWFQQDGATCHTARATIDLLKETFGDRLISRFGPVNWPPRSCDLTPLDYFLCGYVNSLVYADKPQTLDHLEDNIRRVIADIRPQM
ncbi:uncharacterized protein TNCV_4022701 [Trichonephila clavipes]|nr:uncharacterized protein TNCV_4022701 [Trichonephila clavipes]